MKITALLAGLLGLSLLVGCAIVPLEPYGGYNHYHGGYYRGYDYGRPGYYDRGYYGGYYRGGPGYWR